MDVALWAEIRRLHHVERLSGRVLARRLNCSRHTVAHALSLEHPPAAVRPKRASLLDPYAARIAELISEHPELSAVRVTEEIAQHGYQGEVSLVRRYLRRIRPVRSRVYQEAIWEPGDAMQVDWGDCGSIRIGQTTRRVSVFVAVLCYSRMLYLEFTLAQKKADFYRAIVAALGFFGGSPRKLIFDNLKAAVISGAGPASRARGPVWALLYATAALRLTRSGIERRRRVRRALHQAKCTGRPRRAARLVARLPRVRSVLARPGRQRPPAPEHAPATH